MEHDNFLSLNQSYIFPYAYGQFFAGGGGGKPFAQIFTKQSKRKGKQRENILTYESIIWRHKTR